MSELRQELFDFRCHNCGKLFFKGELEKCTIEIKCKHCKTINRIDCADGKTLLKMINQIVKKENNYPDNC